MMQFVYHAISVVHDTIQQLVTVEARAKDVPEGLYVALIRVIDMLVKLDNLKDMKACLNNDFSRYKRAAGGISDEEFRKFLSNEKNFIFATLRGEVKQIIGHEDIIIEILEQATDNLENHIFVTPDEKFRTIRVLPHLMLLLDGDASQPKSFNVFKSKQVKINVLQKLFREYPVVPLYGDMPITLCYILYRITHFDRATMGAQWGETPDVRVINHHNIATHWCFIKDSYNEITTKIAAVMNKAYRFPFRKVLDQHNVEWARYVYHIVKDCFARISEWTFLVTQMLAWKYTHPISEIQLDEILRPKNETSETVSSQRDKPGIEYEKVVRYNFTKGELTALVDVISMIKSLVSIMSRAESSLAPIIRFHIHHEMQFIIQGELLPVIHRADKRKKEAFLSSLLQIRSLAADWIGGVEPIEDYKEYSRKKGKIEEVLHPARVVGPGHTQLNLCRTQVRALYDEKSLGRKKQGFFGRSDLEKDDITILEKFYYDSYYYPYMLNYNGTLRSVSDLCDIWYREFFLELTRCIQFPIEMSLPWILAEHVITHTGTIPIMDSMLYILDIYNDAAYRSLYVLKQQFLYDEIEAEANLVIDQFIYLISEEIYSYYKNYAASSVLDKLYKLTHEHILRGIQTTKTQSLDINPQRFGVLMQQRHIQLLGRSIDLNYLIGQHINNKLYHDIENIIKRFESSDMMFIVDLRNLLQIVYKTHSLLGQYLDIDEFDSIMHEVNEAYGATSFRNRINSHFVRTLVTDLIPNFAYNNNTQRFVRSPVALRNVEYDKPPKHLDNNLMYGSACTKAFENISRLTKKYFGQAHFTAICGVYHSSDFPLLIEALIGNLMTKLQNIQAYVEALSNGISPCKLTKYILRTGGTYLGFEGLLRSILEYEDLKPEVFQTFREIGNLLLFLKDLSDALDFNDAVEYNVIAPLFGYVPDTTGDTNPLNTPFGAVLHNIRSEARVNVKVGRSPVFDAIDDLNLSISVNHRFLQRSRSLFKNVLQKTEEIMYQLNLVNEWKGKIPVNNVLNTESYSEFHRLWSTLVFLFCIQEVASTDDTLSYTDADQFGHGFAFSGCLFVHLLGQRSQYELLDFSYHVLNVYDHDQVSTSSAQIGKVNEATQESVDQFVAAAMIHRQTQNEFFSFLESMYPNKVMSAIKVFHPPADDSKKVDHIHSTSMAKADLPNESINFCSSNYRNGICSASNLDAFEKKCGINEHAPTEGIDLGATLVDASAAKIDDDMSKYMEMCAVLPDVAVRHKMASDGYSSAEIESFMKSCVPQDASFSKAVPLPSGPPPSLRANSFAPPPVPPPNLPMSAPPPIPPPNLSMSPPPVPPPKLPMSAPPPPPVEVKSSNIPHDTFAPPPMPPSAPPPLPSKQFAPPPPPPPKRS